jgi:alpha-glucosidase (family GH31 glycosyl hydrolase)
MVRSVRAVVAVVVGTVVVGTVVAPPSAGSMFGPGGGATDLVVAVAGTHVEVQRDPLQVTFTTDAGEQVLVQSPAGGPGTLTVPATNDPISPGVENPDVPRLHAPFPFLVGTETLTLYRTDEFQGNLQQGSRAGVLHSATRVRDAEHVGDGLRLTLETTDPSGRVLDVAIRPRDCCAVEVEVKPVPAVGVAMMGDSFVAKAGEGFFGFGGRHFDLDQRGKVMANWVNKQNVSLDSLRDPKPGPGEYTETLFPNGPNAAYYPQAQFTSSGGYGFLLDQTELSRFDVAADRADRWSVEVSAPRLRYIVATGAPADAIGTITAISGRHRVPPDWALGPMIDRVAYGLSPAEYEAVIRDDLATLDRYRIPLSGYRIEQWEILPEAVLRDLIAELESRGIHPVAYVLSRTGDPPPGAVHGLLDFTDAAETRAWEERIRRVLDLGFDGFMQDFGEETLLDMTFSDGSTGAQMHNRYPILYHEATRRVIDEYEREHPGREIFFYTRAGFSGSPGSAAYESANFPGDETTDWSIGSGLPSITPDMLNRAVGGAFGFSTDIGGYLDLPRYLRVTDTGVGTTKELLIRWTQWATFSPVFRLHGANPMGTHVPWLYDEETVELYRRYSELRVRAAPLIGELWEEAERTGIPPTRPMWLAEPDNPAARAADQQWMLGDDLLVAPVVTEAATSRDVYFPEGCWEDQHTAQRFRGPTTASVAAPLDVLPHFARCDTEPVGAAPSSSTPSTSTTAPTTTVAAQATGVAIEPRFTG